MMKKKEEWKAEIAKVLSGKVDAAVERYQAEREQGFAELVELDGQLEAFENEKGQFQEQRLTLNPLKASDLKEINLQALRLQKIGKLQRSVQKKISEVVARLTEIPDFDARDLNFLSEADFSSRPRYADMFKAGKQLEGDLAGTRTEIADLEAKAKDAS